jgi:hypothetical protein
MLEGQGSCRSICSRVHSRSARKAVAASSMMEATPASLALHEPMSHEA